MIGKYYDMNREMLRWWRHVLQEDEDRLGNDEDVLEDLMARAGLPGSKQVQTLHHLCIICKYMKYKTCRVINRGGGGGGHCR